MKNRILLPIFLASLIGACTIALPKMFVTGHVRFLDAGAYELTIESAEPWDGGITYDAQPRDSGPNSPDAMPYDSGDWTPPIPDSGPRDASSPDAGFADTGPLQPGDAGSTRDPRLWALGTNLGEPYDYQGEWAYLNNFHQARTWQTWGTHLQNRPGEERVVKWDGTGTLYLAGAVSQRACGTRRICYFARPEIADAPLDNQSITFSRTGDVTNIVDVELRLETSTGLWHPEFLARLSPFKTVRMLDWNCTNGSPQTEWATRPQPNRSPRVNGGIAYEDMIDLANVARKNLWLTVPHRATDDYFRQLAQLVASRLDPSLFVFMEWSNELWNDHPDFTQGQYAQQQGLALGLSTNAFQARLLYQGRRSREMWAIMQPILGARMIRVISGQMGNAWVGEQALNAAGGADAYAVAGYFYGFSTSGVDSTLNQMAAHLTLARARGIPLLGYEGGDHTQVVANARNPLSYDLYRRLTRGWRDRGGGLFMNFNHAYIYSGSSSPGTANAWGSMEYTGQSLDQAHRYRALRDVALETP